MAQENTSLQKRGKSMKKWKQMAAFAVAVLGITLAAKTNVASAAQITGVKQIDAGKDSIKVTWDASLASKSYIVEMSDDKKNWVAKNKTDSTTLYITGLSAGKTYYVRVSGYDSTSWSDDNGTLISEASTPIDVVTAPYVTDQKVVQSAATKKGFSVKFSGNGSDGANYYQLYYNDTLIGTSSKSTLKTKSSLSAGTGYWCKAYACRKSSSGFVAQGTYSLDTFKTLSAKVGTKNFGITTCYDNINVYYVEITKSSTVDGYQLQFLNTKGKSKKTITQTSSSFRIADFLQGTFYQYRVRSYVECGSKKVYSAWSACRYVAVPKSVASTSKSLKLSFNWSKVSGASKYLVYISTNENSGYKLVKKAGAGSRSVSLRKFNGKKIQKSKRYYIKIYTQAKVGKKTVKAEIPWSGYFMLY
jgi:hypothetical protein